MQVADKIHLHIFEDGGVLFCAPIEDFRIFNRVASFVWSCVVEGLTHAEICTRFIQTFGGDRPEVEQAVTEILQRWQGLGYITGVENDHPMQTDFVTALGRLLGSPLLRKRFARSPEQVADTVGVQTSDRDAFLTLDATDLEQQAQALVQKKRSRRRNEDAANKTVSSFLSRFLVRRRRASGNVRYYHLPSMTVAVRYDTAEQEKMTHPVFAHLEAGSQDEPQVEFDVLREPAGHILLEKRIPLKMCSEEAEIAPALVERLEQMAVDSADYLLKFHAAVLRKGDTCVVLPGATGSGKSTLAAAMTHAGFQYLTDETAFVEFGTLKVRPLPLSITVKPDPTHPLSAYYPGLNHQFVYVREDGQRVQYINPPRQDPSHAYDSTFVISHLVFPRYDPKMETSLLPIGKTEAFSRLIGQTTILSSPLKESDVTDLFAWLRRVECFELKVSSLEDAVELIQSTCA